MKKNKELKSIALMIAIIATFISIGLHIYLTLHYYDVKFGMTLGDSICNVSEKLNCDAVSASQFASFLGIPIALWGAVTNFILLYFLAVTRQNLTQDTDKTSRYTLMLSTVTFVASVVMGLISMLALDYFCLFCIAAYVLSIVTFICVWWSTPTKSSKNLIKDTKDIFTSEKWVLGFLIAIPAISFTANLMYLENKGLRNVSAIAEEKANYWAVAPAQNFDTTKGLVLQYSDVEPVMTIVEFADFRCGHCKMAAPPIHSFVKQHPDVRLIFKPFPLDGTCNDAIKGGGDGISCGLALATMCAEKVAQKGWAAHDFIFEKQEEIIRDMNLTKNLDDLIKNLELQPDHLKSCVQDPDMIALVKSTAKEGADAGIQGTPTIFVNGKLLSGGQSVPVLKAVYDKLKK